MYTIYASASLLQLDAHKMWAGEPGLELTENCSIPLLLDELKQFLALDMCKTHKRIYVQAQNENKFFERLKDSMTFIEAAGGVVKNESNEFLFIFRRSKWDLPKGKLEKGEEFTEAAKREVEEECGIKIGKVDSVLGSTYHIYNDVDKLVLKRTAWYLMHCSTQTPVPQVEEDITEVRWFSESELDEVRQNTYPSIIELIGLLPHL